MLEKIYLKNTIIIKIGIFLCLKKHITNPNTLYQIRRTYVRENKNNLSPTLTANMGTSGHNVPLLIEKDNNRIRKLTPKECFNFQDFPKNYKLPKIADSHLYKQNW